MTERIVITNLFALFIAMGACLIAHVAGIKYYARKKAGISLVPAFVSTVESIILMLAAIVLVKLK
jgi:hypothetical protein